MVISFEVLVNLKCEKIEPTKSVTLIQNNYIQN